MSGRLLSRPLTFGAPGMGIDLEVEVLSWAGHGERSEPQSVGPRGLREGSGELNCGPTNRNRIRGGHTTSVRRHRRVGPSSPADGAAQALEARPRQLSRAGCPRDAARRRQAGCRQRPTLVAQLGDGAPSGAAERSLQTAGSSPTCQLKPQGPRGVEQGSDGQRPRYWQTGLTAKS
jgi:hypothetical protein